MPRSKKKQDVSFTHFDPSDNSIGFRDLVLDAACCFMDRKDFADKVLRVPLAEFDRMCVKDFGMGSRDLFNLCQSMTDIHVRKRLQELALSGNGNAMDVYTKYISGLQKEKTDNTLRIAVVSLPSKDDDDDDDDDGGVHVSQQQ